MRAEASLQAWLDERLMPAMDFVLAAGIAFGALLLARAVWSFMSAPAGPARESGRARVVITLTGLLVVGGARAAVFAWNAGAFAFVTDP